MQDQPIQQGGKVLADAAIIGWNWLAAASIVLDLVSKGLAVVGATIGVVIGLIRLHAIIREKRAAKAGGGQ